MDGLVQESKPHTVSVTHIRMALDLWRWLNKWADPVTRWEKKCREGLFTLSEPEYTCSLWVLDRGERLFILSNNPDAREEVYKRATNKFGQKIRIFVAGALFFWALQGWGGFDQFELWDWIPFTCCWAGLFSPSPYSLVRQFVDSAGLNTKQADFCTVKGRRKPCWVIDCSRESCLKGVYVPNPFVTKPCGSGCWDC